MRQNDLLPEIAGRKRELWGPLLALASWFEQHGVDDLSKVVTEHALATIDAYAEDLTSYRDEQIYAISLPTGLDVVFFLRGNDVFVTYDLATAQQAVDHLAPGGGPVHSPTDLEELFAWTSPDRALRAALTNDRDEVFRLWQRVAVQMKRADRLRGLAAELRGATLSGGLAGDDTLEGQIGLWCPDATWATGHAAEALEAFQAGLSYEGLELTAEAAAEGDWIRIDFRAQGLPGLLESLFELGRGEAPERDAPRGVPDAE